MKNETIPKPSADLRFEVIAAEMQEKPVGGATAGWVVRPRGTFRRGYSRDVLTLKRLAEFGGRICFDLSRAGLFDTLPEQLFHSPDNDAKARDGEDMAEDVRRRRREEEAARKFFLPLEQEFYRLRLLTELEERKSLLTGDDRHLNPVLTAFWSLDECFDNRQKMLLLLLLPLANRIVNDFPLTAACLSLVAGEPVGIRRTPPKEVEVPEELWPELGVQRLGLDWTLGTSFRAATQSLEVAVGPVSAARLDAWLPGGEGRRALYRLFDYFLPAEADVTMTVALRPEDEGFDLSEAALGYATVLQ